MSASRLFTVLVLSGGALCGTARIADAQQAGTPPPPPTPQQDSIRIASRLDLDGKHAESKEIFQRLIDGAPTPAARAVAQRRMAISYGFQGDCANTAKYHEMVIGYWKTREVAEPQNAFYQQGEMANEAARVCIDLGQLDMAERLYVRGTELGDREPEPRTHPRALWEFRLAHARGRLAARRGNAADARAQVANARRILDADTVMAGQQARFYPYLVGYVALYTDDLATADVELTRAVGLPGNSTDPFLHALLGMTYEKQGNESKARAMYQKAYDLSTGHSPPSAFSRPFARRKLGLN